MVNGQVVVATEPLESVTLIVNVPAVFGVPVIAPVDAFSVRPVGRVPLATENVNGAVPPVTVIAGLLNAVPTMPDVAVGQVSDGPPTIVNGHVPLATTPFASATLIVNVPALCGVPVIAPVDVFNVRPVGRVPVATEKVNGAVPPVTVIAGMLNATPTSPEFVAEQVIVGAATIVNGHVPVATTPFASLT
jgi:hypothetical protein